MIDNAVIHPRLYIYITVLLFLVPLPWLTAWLAGICFHEFCHLVAVRLCGGKVCSFRIGIGGANMECVGLSNGEYLISTLAGPLGGFLLCLCGCWFPRVAICSWILSIYNLFPLQPLDGGNIMRILIKDKKKFLAFEKTFLLLLSVLAIYLAIFMQLGLLPVLVIGTLWYKNRKIPCKEHCCGVQ